MNSFNSAFTALQSTPSNYFYFTDSTGKKISPTTISKGFTYYVFDTGSNNITLNTNISLDLYFAVLGHGGGGGGGSSSIYNSGGKYGGNGKYGGAISGYFIPDNGLLFQYTVGNGGSGGNGGSSKHYPDYSGTHYPGNPGTKSILIFGGNNIQSGGGDGGNGAGATTINIGTKNLFTNDNIISYSIVEASSSSDISLYTNTFFTKTIIGSYIGYCTGGTGGPGGIATTEGSGSGNKGSTGYNGGKGLILLIHKTL